MAETSNIRMERIEKLLRELEYEVTRGMIDGEIDEHLGLDFYVPISKTVKNGVVHCQFRTRPTERFFNSDPEGNQPRLRVVGK